MGAFHQTSRGHRTAGVSPHELVYHARDIRHFPLILVGEGEWDGLLDWLRDRGLANRRIDAADLAYLHSVRRPAEVVEIVDAAATTAALMVSTSPARGDRRQSRDVYVTVRVGVTAGLVDDDYAARYQEAPRPQDAATAAAEAAGSGPPA